MSVIHASGQLDDHHEISMPPPSNQQTLEIPDYAIDKLKFYTSKDDTEYIRNYLEDIWFTINNIFSKDVLPLEKLADKIEFMGNVKRFGEEAFINVLQRIAATGSWADLLNNDVFFKRASTVTVSVSDTFNQSATATVQAWTSTFKGNAATVLLLTISDYLGKKEKIYSNHSNIVNSSGTGKSRMVDELAMQVITIPMCLREDGTQGFPPPDHHLRSWLISIADPMDQAQVAKKLHCFITALLMVTRTRLEEIIKETMSPSNLSQKDVVLGRQMELARTFRERMTKGQSFEASNDYRKTFYRDVISLASAECTRDNQVTEPGSPPRYVDLSQCGVRESAEELCRLIDPQKTLDSPKGPRRPLVILAFDESHLLTDNPKNSTWNLFLELRRTLREMVKSPIFSLFLSTARRFYKFSPEIRSDPSTRIAKADLIPLDPISEISFDDLAFPAGENTVTLNRVVQMDWISHLGRPLFGSYHDGLLSQANAKEEPMLNFAKTKLLDNRSTLTDAGPSGSLACLSVRFALEFNMNPSSQDVACKQVERHMRLCLSATTRFDHLLTLAGSEPLLAEAAFELMRHSESPVRQLANHSDLHCIDRGRRGELVAALIIMQARDIAVGEGKRSISVSDFMKALLPEAHFQTFQASYPVYWREGQHKPFHDIFRDYSMWFNHVIKVEKGNMIKAESLWKFITRGAMVMCKDNQKGVDIVLPACHNQENLSRDSVTAILIQVKNDKDFQCNINKTLFDGMDPHQVGLFSDPQNSRPVIRLVFALASETAGVLFPASRERERRGVDEFTSFDIWCAGLSAATFRFISDDLVGPYKILLDRSLQPHDAFQMKEVKELAEETRIARGILRRGMAPLITDEPGHDAIHARVSEEE
ncbi:hypothetical protein BC827DRAFT_1379867 [Russula dissimulans]|nr:hypothetical protein BC827DRAFT_1379867 [Russula dissimulans]